MQSRCVLGDEAVGPDFCWSWAIDYIDAFNDTCQPMQLRCCIQVFWYVVSRLLLMLCQLAGGAVCDAYPRYLG